MAAGLVLEKGSITSFAGTLACWIGSWYCTTRCVRPIKRLNEPLHQSGGWLLEYSDQSQEFSLHMLKTQNLWLKGEASQNNLPASGLLYRLKVCRMQSDDAFPISRHNFQQLEGGDRGEIALLPAESESLHRLGFWQSCGVRLRWLVLVGY